MDVNMKIYTWGRGNSGQLGHGDRQNQDSPKLVEAFKVCRRLCAVSYFCDIIIMIITIMILK